MIIADAAYPSLPWVVKPYPAINLSENKDRFNFRQSSARMAIEQAFGLLKCRFRILLKRQDTKMDNLPYIIYACFILHNLCIDTDDTNVWDFETEDSVPETENGRDGTQSGETHIRDYLMSIL